MRRHAALLATGALFSILIVRPGADAPGAAVHAQAVYAALRSAGLADGYEVADFVVKKDAATFTLTGTIYLLAPVQDRVTGAVFVGDGSMA